jgi:uncharacterized beta-barrel protein YwiB (DUF1934 family)
MSNNNSKAKNVIIHLISTYCGVSDDEHYIEAATETINEKDESGIDQLDLTTEGVIRQNGNRIELEYFETELTGMEGSCTSISFERENPGIVSMIRTGTVITALVFEEGKRHICAYNTDFTAFEICVKANKVENNMTENGGELMLDYGVEFRGAATERTLVKLTATPTGN